MCVIFRLSLCCCCPPCPNKKGEESHYYLGQCPETSKKGGDNGHDSVPPIVKNPGEPPLGLSFFLKLLEIHSLFSHKFPGDFPNLDIP